METKTYPEIMDQYRALRKTAEYILSKKDEINSFYAQPGFNRIIYLGCGSSYSVCKTLACTASLVLKYPATALPAGDLMLHMETYAPMLKDALIVTVSRSGETDEVVNSVTDMRKAGYHISVLSIIEAAGSRVAKISDLALEIPWAFDESVCQTRSVTNLAGAGQLVTAVAAGRQEIIDDILYVAEHGNDYIGAIEQTIAEIAGRGFTKAIVLADAEAYGLAEEGALAFNEIAYTPSVCKHVLDFRHGPIVLADKDTLAIVCMNADGFSYQAALVRDLIVRGAGVITYSAAPLPTVSDKTIADFNFGRKLSPSVEGIPLLAVAQLLAYYSAMARGIDPDHPQGLDPWIAL
ncbi:MAG: SIS domain-containing protein [Christensenellaceae bacterium]|nr:SIS domain-containing protein [Christensenellaceae bacterium]